MSYTNPVENLEYWLQRPRDDKRMDWRNDAQGWIEEYWESRNHPHRKTLADILDTLQFDSLLEVGCNCGPNLSVFSGRSPEKEYAGIDINQDVIDEARKNLPNVSFRVGAAHEIPFPDKSFDIVLADAVLMYIDDETLLQVIDEFRRVTRKYIVLVEWKSKMRPMEIIDHHFARTYREWFFPECDPCTAIIKKIKPKEWPSQNWIDNGYVFVFRVPSETLEKSS